MCTFPVRVIIIDRIYVCLDWHSAGNLFYFLKIQLYNDE